MKPQKKSLRCLRLISGMILAVGVSKVAAAKDLPAAPVDPTGVTFNALFLSSSAGAPEADLTALQVGAGLPAGTYLVDVSLNGRPVGREEIEFNRSESGNLEACLSEKHIAVLKLSQAYLKTLDGYNAGCDLVRRIPASRLRFHEDRMQLDVRVPQVALAASSLSSRDHSAWDQGINAFRLNYSMSSSWSRLDQGDAEDRQYGTFNAGLDVKGWRLRSSFTYQSDVVSEDNWSRRDTFMYRAFPAIRSELTLGETFTGSRFTESLPISGVRLASDKGMLDPRFQGFSPRIRGVARTNARIEVRQNGFLIYSRYVTPGAFQIEDLPSLSNGDLDVSITEEDGEVRTFVQPYSQVPNLLRPGFWEYSISAGRYRNDNFDEPYLLNGELSRGLANNMTLYGGSLMGDFYQSAQLGLGANLGFIGGLSFDVNRSRSKDAMDVDKSGSSYRLFYAKSLAYGTNIQLLGYRYATENFRTFTESVSEREGEPGFDIYRKRRVEATFSQRLGRRSSVYLSGVRDVFWNASGARTLFIIGYNSSWRELSYGLTATDTEEISGQSSATYNLSLSIPLGGARRPHYLSYRASTNQDSDTLHTAGVSGLVADNDDLSYAVEAGYSEVESATNSALRLGYAGEHLGLSGGASHTPRSDLYYVQANGSAVLHGGGLTTGRDIGETALLAEVEGLKNASFRAGAQPVRTNRRGHALIPRAQPYRDNRVTMGLEDVSSDVEVGERTVSVVPVRGALVKVSYEAQRVRRFLVRVELDNGAPAALGSQVMRREGEPVGLVSKGGYVLINARESDGPEYRLASNGAECWFRLQPDNPSMGKKDVISMSATCR